MPCYEVRLTSVEFRAKHKDLLLKALDELGMRRVERSGRLIVQGDIEIDLNGGQVVCPVTKTDAVNAIKRQYSAQVIMKEAKAQRWGIQQKGKNKFVVRRYA